MKSLLKNKLFLRFIDILFSPLTVISSYWFKLITKVKPRFLPLTDKIFMKSGILPVQDHYYQPLINPKKHLTRSLREDRSLPGIEWNIEEQLNILEQFKFNDELTKIPFEKTDSLEFYYNNNSFVAGDAEYFYNILRLKKPHKIIEIGCGYSTLLAQKALIKNKKDNPDYTYEHICIEPYEMPWLEQLDVKVIRRKVEELDTQYFSQLAENDILFIDSSHIIRPQGDVLFEFLQVLPILNKGVIVHVHDIFSPKDYLNEWVFSHVLWNEQYLLEAFLTNNKNFKIIGALNFLSHKYFDQFAAKSPIFSQLKGEPGSFWMQKTI